VVNEEVPDKMSILPTLFTAVASPDFNEMSPPVKPDPLSSDIRPPVDDKESLLLITIAPEFIPLL